MLLQLLSQYSYPAIFVLLLASGLGMPVSEDVILITTGALVAKGLCHPVWSLAVAYCGLVLGDFALFTIGQKLGRKALESKHVARICPPARLAKIEARFAKWGAIAVFFARFVAGLRAATFFTAGVVGVERKRFLLADAVAAAIWVPALIFLARTGASYVNVNALPPLKTVALVAVGALALALLVRRLLRRTPGAIVAAEKEVEDAGP